jgi:Bifunctional DNA primase/polymerase, N-terminal
MVSDAARKLKPVIDIGKISARRAAKDYLARGWKPVPIPSKEKNPFHNGWQLEEITTKNVGEKFITYQNIGVQLGRPSNGLCDVDLDCAEARELAPYFLPETNARFGRESSPCAHWLYVTDLWKTARRYSETFDDPEPNGNDEHGACMVELRTGRVEKGKDVGAVSLVPPSLHPSGERVKWVPPRGEPTKIDGQELRRCVADLAAATLLVRHYPPKGNRHPAALVLGGLLARANWNVDDVDFFVETVAHVAHDEEWKKRCKDASSAVEMFDNDEAVPGVPRMREVWGEKVADCVAKWLGVRSSFTGDDRAVASDPDKQRIDELSRPDDLAYEQQRKEVAEALNLRVTVLDEQVRQRKAKRKRAAPARPPPPDFATLTKLATPLIECENVLQRFAEDFRKVIAGEGSTGKLLYLVATSRLFDKAMHAAIKGPSSGGKSEVRKRVLDFFPPEDVISFTALSEKALLYMPGDFVHKILSMGEAITGEEVKFQDYLLRELMSENRLQYPVVQKINDEFQTIVVEKNGPVSFIVTTTRNKLNPENETRMLSLEVDDSEAQTKAVLQKVASSQGYNRGERGIDFKVWHDYQRWLSAGDSKVKIPFALTLARMIPPKTVRLRRDFAQVLLAIKAHALLHRDHRKHDDKGNIIATIADDYATVRELMADLLATTAEVKLRATMVETIAAVQALQPLGQLKEGTTVQAVLRHLKLDRSSAYRRLQAAVNAEFLVNVEERKGRPGQYRVSEHLQPKEIEMLPDPKVLDEAVRTRKRKARAR